MGKRGLLGGHIMHAIVKKLQKVKKMFGINKRSLDVKRMEKS